MFNGNLRAISFGLGLLLLAAANLSAAAIRNSSDFDTNQLSANDDGFTGPHDLGFTANLFGVSTTQIFVNNNGNVTIGAGLSAFTPSPISALGGLIIAPFWADVDTRVGNVTTFGTSVVDGNAAFGVNWNDVGYFNRHADLLNDFQLVLISRGDTCPVGVPGCGNFDVEFNYNKIQWETGDLSSGSGGLGGSSARAGYSNASGTSFELAGSGVNGAFLDGGPNSLVAGSFNSAVAGRYLFEVRNGAVGTPGASQQNPVLPNSVGPNGELIFNNIPTGIWSDPPNTYGFDYTGTGGTLFTQIGLPTGFLDPFTILTGPSLSDVLGSFAGGTTVDFVSLLGGPIGQFRLTGINPTFDSTVNPAGFPSQLFFSTPTGSFEMSPLADADQVPEPGTVILLGAGLTALFLRARRR